MTAEEYQKYLSKMAPHHLEGKFGWCPSRTCEWMAVGGTSTERYMALKSHVQGHWEERKAAFNELADWLEEKTAGWEANPDHGISLEDFVGYLGRLASDARRQA